MTRSLLVAAAALALACAPEGTIGKDTDGATASSAPGTGGSTGGHGSGPTDGGAGTDGGSGSGTGLTCPPHEPTDACGECLSDSCCPQLQACTGVCDCIRTCVAEGHSLDSCKTTCGDDGGAYDALHQCQVDTCGAHCP